MKQNTFIDQETAFRGQYSKQVFETLYFIYRSTIWKMAALIAFGFIGRILMLSNANLIGIWVDSFAHKQTSGFFAGLTSHDYIQMLIALTASGFLFTSVFRIGFSRTSAHAISQFYDEVTLRTSRLPMGFFDQNPVGRIVTRFSSDYGNIFRLFGGPLAELFAIVFDLLSMLVLVAIASPYYLSVVAVIAALNYTVYRLNRDFLRRERRLVSASRSPSIAHFAETTQGASTIRTFARQQIFFDHFSKLNDVYLDQRLRTSLVVSGFSMQMTSTTALLLLSTGGLGIYLLEKGLVSIGSIGVAFTFIILSGTSLQMFFEWMAQFEEAMTGVERLDNYLRRDLEPGLKLPSQAVFPTGHPLFKSNEEEELRSLRLVKSASAAVRIEDLWFRYSPDLPYVLKGIDFNIRPGEKIGIVGRTGSGKSTLVQALFHLYPFEKGRISIDGVAPNVSIDGLENKNDLTVDLGVYRRSFALISQEPTLFRGTIRENLDLAYIFDDARLIDALDRVGLKSWLAHQPLGLESPVEERGRNLSAGEKQLLCMARCLLQNAPVIVMDEATSSVDPQSEEILVRATREFFSDRTQIIIAHRLSTLDGCDRVLWLDRGEVRLFDRPEKVLPVFKSTRL